MTLVLRAFALATMLAALAAATAHAEPRVAVTDPTGGTFSGDYVVTEDDPSTKRDERRESRQQGYIGVYDDGVVACNGNGDLPTLWTVGADRGPYTLSGYVWVGSGYAASNQTFGEQAGNHVGVGNNHRTAPTRDGRATGESPCPDENPDGVNEEATCQTLPSEDCAQAPAEPGHGCGKPRRKRPCGRPPR